MKRRDYPHKAAEELRIPITFPLSGERLKRFRQKFVPEFEQAQGRKPTEQEIRHKASEIALQAIDAYCMREGDRI